MTPKIATGTLMLMLSAVPAANAQDQEQLPSPPAGQILGSAGMIDPKGQQIGTAAFVETPNGVLIQARFDQLPAGTHAFHIHENGVCEPPDFESAGGHYNPTGANHGYLGPAGPHAGDLPNIFVESDGPFRADMFTDRVSLDAGSAGLFPEDGTALVVHEQADDYETDPAGAAGPRIACGVIEQQTQQ